MLKICTEKVLKNGALLWQIVTFIVRKAVALHILLIQKYDLYHSFIRLCVVRFVCWIEKLLAENAIQYLYTVKRWYLYSRYYRDIILCDHPFNYIPNCSQNNEVSDLHWSRIARCVVYGGRGGIKRFGQKFKPPWKNYIINTTIAFIAKPSIFNDFRYQCCDRTSFLSADDKTAAM